MNRFNKENLYDSLTMFVYQIAMMIFALMLTFSANLLSDRNGVSPALQNGLLAGTSIASILFYCYLLFYKCYEIGQKDGIKIEAGRLKYDPWKCFFISLIANIPNLLLGLLELIGKLCINGVSLMQPVSDMVSTDLSPIWAINLYDVCHTLARFLQAPYVGVAKVWFEGIGFFDLLSPFVAILVCTFSYQIGVRRCNVGGTRHKKTKNNASRYQ